MRMTERQIRSLMDAEDPTSTICYHGMNILPLPDDAPFKILRIIGHLMFEDDEVEPDTVPDHRTVSFDIPMMPDTMMHISASLAHAAMCGTSDINPPFPVPDGEWIPVREMPDILKRILGINRDDKNGD